MHNLRSCVAWPCEEDRVKESGFCTKHEADHEKSVKEGWVRDFRALLVLVALDKESKKKVGSSQPTKEN
jgi:hypothetical protein